MNGTRQFIIDIVAMFPGDGRHLRRRNGAGGVSELAATLPPPMIVARHRGTTVSSHEATRVVLQGSEPPMALQPLGGSVVWDGFPAIPFRGADPTRLRIYFGEQLSRDVLMPATDRSPRRPGCSTRAMPRVFRD